MDLLPQEVVDRISSYLERWDLRNTLTVNSKFQAAAERHSGAFEHVSLNEASADEFLATFSDRRFRYLRHVNFSTTLIPDDLPPNHQWSHLEGIDEDDLPQCRESRESLQNLDEGFTKQIEFLFNIIKTLEDRISESHRARQDLPHYLHANHGARPNHLLSSSRTRQLARPSS